MEKEIMRAINSYDMGLVGIEEMIEKVCAEDSNVGDKVLDRLNRIRESEEYRNIVSKRNLELEVLILKDEAITSMIGYHRLLNLA